MTKRFQQQGSVLVYSLLIMSVIMAIGIGMNAVFLRNLENVRQARESVVALYAADAATELCLYEVRSATDVDESALLFTEGATFRIVEIGGGDVTADCNALSSSSFQFRATGVYRDASRALEISI